VAEELLFRSALLGLGARSRSRTTAVITTSLAFGAWHVIPSLHAHRANSAHAQLTSRMGGAPASIAMTVAVTAGAGGLLAVLRLRSRSVVAPVIAHGALNAVAFLAARWAGRGTGRR
jgi:membrane protease YdiL (CAAX protease family)